MLKAGFIVLVLLLGVQPVSSFAAASWVDPMTGIEFVRIEKGCYEMGLPAKAFLEDDPGLHSRAKAEMPQHQVCVAAFWLARHELRETAWQKLMGERASPKSEDLPAVNMTWSEVQEFLGKLNAQAQLGGASSKRFRLPTEGEWEYACRAGAKALDRVPVWQEHDPFAWYGSFYGGYSGSRPAGVQAVGGKRANAWGLHDMLGNVWEWVQDSYQADGYARHTLYNPVINTAGAKRVIRGGSVRTNRVMTRCEARAWQVADEKLDTVGLRLVRED